jgi:hypothetical protein
MTTVHTAAVKGFAMAAHPAALIPTMTCSATKDAAAVIAQHALQAPRVGQMR